MNRIFLTGRMVNDPELKSTGSGKSVMPFTLAVVRVYSKKADEQVTDFINCLAWDKAAENLAKYSFKGQKLAIEGRLCCRQYTTDKGEKRFIWEVVVESFEFLSRKDVDNAAPKYVAEDDMPF